MQTKASSLFLFLFCVINFSYAAEWYHETPVLLRDELKSIYDTNLHFASRDNITEYVAITENVVLFAVNQIGLFLYDLKEHDIKKIPSPFDLRDVKVFSMSYDKKNNTIHMLILDYPQRNSHYYVLRFDTYSWNKIEELSSPIFQTYIAYYDSSDEKIYCLDVAGRGITIFDFQSRKIIEKVRLFDEPFNIHAIYGSPVRILGDVRTGTERDDIYYFVFDFQTRTKEIFQNTAGKRGRSDTRDYVPLGPYRFLCILGIRLELSVIIEIDLRNDTYKTVAFDNFNHSLSMLRRNHGNLLNFIVIEEIGHFNRVNRFSFCSWEYPGS
jgi:hypothetical protein